ncbi:MAG: LuxR C-terminal-related transcriptional regulator [Desulfobacterales bacterium]
MANSSNRELEIEIAELQNQVNHLKEVESRFSAFLDQLDCEAYILDEKNHFIYMNQVMYGKLEKNGHLGKPAHKTVPKRTAENIIEEHKKVLSGDVIDKLKTMEEKAGQKRIYHVIKFPLSQQGEIKMIGGIARDVTKQSAQISELSKSNENLEMKKMMLEESNTALRVLLKKRDEDRVETEEKMIYNVKELIKPYIAKLKETELSALQYALVNVIELNIDDIISPFVRDMSLKFMKLTPMEIQVANLIKQGKTTKQIAELMNLSGRTIETHRKKIRTKIGIGNKKANLRSHLLSLQ